MSCGGSIDFDSAKQAGYIAPDLSKEEWKKRASNFGLKLDHERPPVPVDHRGLIWVDGKIMVNLFQCSHHYRQTAKRYGDPDKLFRLCESPEV